MSLENKMFSNLEKSRELALKKINVLLMEVEQRINFKVF